MAASGEEHELLEVFHDEAEDLLGRLESCLLELESDPSCGSLLDEGFRLLHTLKGTCAMYGFSDAAGLAHEVETLLDRARHGKMPITSDLIELALSARDALSALVSGTEEEAARARMATQVLMDGMQGLLASEGGDVASFDAEQPVAEPEGQEEETYHVVIRPRGDLFVRGVSLTGILAELARLGRTSVEVDASKVPPLDSLDPEQCYLEIGVELRTSAPERAIRDAMMFLDEGEFVCQSSREQAAQAGRASRAALARAKQRGGGVRVSTERLDDLVDLVGELVTTQMLLRDAAAESNDERVQRVAEVIERLTHDMRETVLDMRMVPIGSAFGRFARYVRDLSKELGKDVVLKTHGATTELDRMVIERIEEPILHIIRNCIDHGIEPPVERRLAGKPEHGTISLSAYHASGSMYVRISDDGRGLDLAAVREKARAAGLIQADAEPDDRLLAQLVFEPGFSTASRVTAVSGRGVGLDVVKKTVTDLQGSVELISEPGRGMTVLIRLPLTLAIIDGLLVAVGDERYVLPASMIEECVTFEQPEGWAAHGRDLLDIRGETVPFVRLRTFFGVSDAPGQDEIACVASADGERFALVVDKVEDRLPVVIKSLGRALRRTEGVLGASVLGDGSVALI
ncbi:MAG: chemotaxis protein CheA, partial [Coriobacteriia bacterium]|nr:chemotaxis protein CheA [Coriobacteriia bacterium]